jgi:hypothetical protein
MSLLWAPGSYQPELAFDDDFQREGFGRYPETGR